MSEEFKKLFSTCKPLCSSCVLNDLILFCSVLCGDGYFVLRHKCQNVSWLQHEVKRLLPTPKCLLFIICSTLMTQQGGHFRFGNRFCMAMRRIVSRLDCLAGLTLLWSQMKLSISIGARITGQSFDLIYNENAFFSHIHLTQWNMGKVEWEAHMFYPGLLASFLQIHSPYFLPWHWNSRSTLRKCDQSWHHGGKRKRQPLESNELEFAPCLLVTWWPIARVSYMWPLWGPLTSCG